MKRSKALMLACLSFIAAIKPVFAQNTERGELGKGKMAWFEDAKLGIFIHWGIYSVRGISESWSFFNNYINHEAYMAQLEGFTAKNYDPEEWVSLIEASGAKYSVITSKHHDGVALWHSNAPLAITTQKDAGAKQDLLTPFVQALKKKDIKTGIYYSLPDWSYPDYDVFTRYRKRYLPADDLARWERFISYQQQQLRELSERYHPDLLWFDGDWEHNDEEWRSAEISNLLTSYNPQIIINSRLGSYGHYDTPEQGVPIVRPNAPYWELCYTINDSWGYQPLDKRYKSGNMLIRTLVDCIAMGGNLLLDIGPKPDGSIPEEQVEVLQAMGRWTKKHGQAIYGTRAGLDRLGFKGKNALSKDGKTLYLYLETKELGEIVVRNLVSKVKEAYVVSGSNTPVGFEQKGERLLLNVPKKVEDEDVTVLALRFDEQVRLGEGNGKNSHQLGEARSALQIEALVNELDKGVNLTDDLGLTVDGLDFNVEQLSSISKDTAVYQWVKKHAEALCKTGEALPLGHYNGYSALSADKQTLYLFARGVPTGPIALKGLKNAVQRVRIVGEGSMIGHSVYNKLYWSSIPGIVYIDIPKDRLDEHMTVISVLLDKPLELYRESIGVVDDNK